MGPFVMSQKGGNLNSLYKNQKRGWFDTGDPGNDMKVITNII